VPDTPRKVGTFRTPAGTSADLDGYRLLPGLRRQFGGVDNQELARIRAPTGQHLRLELERRCLRLDAGQPEVAVVGDDERLAAVRARPSILSCPKNSPLSFSSVNNAPRSSFSGLDATVTPRDLSLSTAAASLLTPTSVSTGLPSSCNPPASARYTPPGTLAPGPTSVASAMSAM